MHAFVAQLKGPASLVLIPAVAGICLLLAVAVDLHQFRSGEANIMVILDREIVLVLIGFASSLVVAAVSLKWLIQRRWLKFTWAALSLLVFFVCFVAGGKMGGAFLYAT